jgi:hypothetical protein
MGRRAVINTILRLALFAAIAALALTSVFPAKSGFNVSAGSESEESVSDGKMPEHYISFGGMSEWDYSVNTSCHVNFEDGLLKITAGKEGASGRVQGSPSVEIRFADTSAKVLKYPYIAIRIRTSRRDLGGKVTCAAGYGKSKVDGSFDYADTDDWQTVVADMSGALQNISDKSDRTGTWRDSVKLFPFGSSAGKVNAGETAVVESIAFFKTADSAKAYTGLSGTDTGDNDMSGKWLYDSFTRPGASYRMMKLLYNFDSAYKTVADKLFEGYGYGGITTNVTFNSRYLKSDSEFKLLDDAFKYCLEKGMDQLWLYDEYQWPSGSAYGMVTEGAPEYEPYGLAKIEKSGSGKSVYELPPEYAVIKHAVLIPDGGSAKSVGFRDRTIDIDENGKWTLKVFATYDAWVERDSLNPWQKGRPYVNIMSRGAIAKFISLTHEKYKSELNSSFGSVEAFFTDEPSLFTSNMTNPIHTGGKVSVFLVPWEDTLPSEFEAMHGYSLFDHVESLYGGDSEEDFVVRVNFYETVAKLTSENYFGQIAGWCEANGTKGSGHLLLEEKLAYHVALYGDFLKCMNRTGYAGCDLLQVSPKKIMSSETYVGSYVAIKMASSSARNTNKEHVLVEFNPEAIADDYFKADPFGTSFAGAVITRMYGADKFVMLNPQESYNSVQATALNDCVGRLNVLLEGAKMNSEVGVYYPIATVQGLMKADTVYEGKIADISEKYNRICYEMLKERYDYNYVDDEAVLSGTINGGKLECGRTSYSVIVMPMVRAIDPSVLDKLLEFRNAGGKLIWVDSMPEISTVAGKSKEIINKLSAAGDPVIYVYENNGSVDALMAALDSSISYGYTVSGDETIFTSPYVRDGRQLIVAVNSSSADKMIGFSMEGPDKYDVYDLYTGKITEKKSGDNFVLGGYKAVVIAMEGAKEPVVSDTTPEPAKRNDNGSRFPVIPVAAAAGAVIAGGIAVAAVTMARKKKSGGNDHEK